MTENETRQILEVLKVFYPQSFQNWDKQQAKIYLAGLANGLKDVPLKNVEVAVYHFVYETDREFAPNVGQILKYINQNPQWLLNDQAAKFMPQKYQALPEPHEPSGKLEGFMKMLESKKQESEDDQSRCN